MRREIWVSISPAELWRRLGNAVWHGLSESDPSVVDLIVRPDAMQIAEAERVRSRTGNVVDLRDRSATLRARFVPDRNGTLIRVDDGLILHGIRMRLTAGQQERLVAALTRIGGALSA